MAELSDPNVVISAVSPEMILALTGIILMIYDSFRPNKLRETSIIAILGLLASAGALFYCWANPILAGGGFNGMIVTDGIRLSFSLVMLIVSGLTILMSGIWMKRESVDPGEFHTMLIFATVGMLFMASGNDLVIIFLGLETLSIATYVMAGMRKNDLRSNESAMKYFILGSFASGFLLYGMALLYGAGGTTNISKIAVGISNAQYPLLYVIGGAMLLIGFGFKIATVPFHVWTPDVYEGAPTPVTAFMAAGPKTAGFASFIRIFVLGFPLIAGLEVSAVLHESWITVLSILAILTMTFGNVAAVVQNNIKRMLAYSSIAHAGYAMIGFIGAGMAKTAEGQDTAIAAVAFYLLSYAITNIGAFAIVTLIAQKNDRRVEFDDYNGIGFKSPVIAFSLSLFMLSLFGMPLTAGFIGKILVFRPALESGSALLLVVVIAAVLNTAVSAYYYLRLIVVMFFKDRTTSWVAPKIPAPISLLLIIAVLGVFYLGIFGESTIQLFSQQSVSAQLK
ncbi:MAG: NADH-quinone oxidoreductase subunit N [Pyrinomonadaceae bacterium]